MGSINNYYCSLLSQLTLEEKVGLLSGSSLTSTTGVPRLGIPNLTISDSINGVRGSKSHLEDEGTACFPSSTCLASTWNKPLLRHFGEEVGRQAQFKSVQIVSGPNINMHRDPRNGRNFETFSEDPLLTGQVAAEIIKGIQSRGLGTCLKHFMGNEAETLRRAYDVTTSWNSRTMRELYLKAFQYCIREVTPTSLMTAYNQMNGSYCCQTPLIKEVLRKEWNYDGCIMSDWYGTTSCEDALNASLDLEMPGPPIFRGKRLLQAVAEGRVEKSAIDGAALNVLRLIDRTRSNHSDNPEQIVIDDQCSQMCRELAAQGIVLLKNDNDALPLNSDSSPTIAVIGKGALVPTVSGGGSAACHPQYVKSFLDAVRAMRPDTGKIGYAKGVETNVATSAMPTEILKAKSGEEGIDIDYYNDNSSVAVISEVLQQPQMVMLGYVRPGLDENFHYKMSTTVTVQEAGIYTIGAQISGAYSLLIDGEEVLAGPGPEIAVTDFLFLPIKLERTLKFHFEKSRPYHIQLNVRSRPQPAGNMEPCVHAAKLLFEPERRDDRAIEEARTLAGEADFSIIFAGRTDEHESEGFDLETLKLSQGQSSMIKSVAAVSKKTVLVLHGGNPIDVSDYVDDVDAILFAHFPGQEGAQALTDIVFGKTNPSGRLATSWPFRLDAACVPSYDSFKPMDTGLGPKIEYKEGLEVGYRHRKAAEHTRYPFGYGLSYSTFKCSDLSISETGSTNVSYIDRRLRFDLSVRNEGSYAGHHVVQVYSEAPTSGASLFRPSRELVAFEKVWLEPGETKQVTLTAACRDITGIWDEEKRTWISCEGEYSFVVEECRSARHLEGTHTWTAC